MSIESIKVRDLNTTTSVDDNDLLLVAKTDGTTQNVKVSELSSHISSSSSSVSGGSLGPISALHFTGNTFNAGFSSIPATYGMEVPPGIYAVDLPKYIPGPYSPSTSNIHHQVLACPEGIDMYNNAFWTIQVNRGGSSYSGLAWKNGRLSIYNHTGRTVIFGAFAMTLYHMPI